MAVAYRASGTSGGVIGVSPRAAALAFFEKYPSKRKCDVDKGTHDGSFFTMVFDIRNGVMPASWKDVTKKTAVTLPSE